MKYSISRVLSVIGIGILVLGMSVAVYAEGWVESESEAEDATTVSASVDGSDNGIWYGLCST
ncbi:hypothetical protein ACFLWZ_05615 [Chloroflexota bacterium]